MARGSTWKKVKQGAKRALFLWKIVTVVLLSSILIPLFIAQGDSFSFVAWTVALSIVLYVVLAAAARKAKGKIRTYLKAAHEYLIIAAAIMTTGYILKIFENPIANATFTAAAILYAVSLQKINIFRVFL